MVSADQQMVINSSNHEPLNISVMGEGHLIMAQIFYDYHPEELGPVVIPREKVSFDDFRTCVYLANVQFRGAKFIFRKLKNQWFDEELSGAIQKLERIYLPFLIWFFGLGGVAAIGVDSFSGIMWIVALLSWTAIDIFLISPLLYLIFVKTYQGYTPSHPVRRTGAGAAATGKSASGQADEKIQEYEQDIGR